MRTHSNSFPSCRRKTRGRGIAAPSQSRPDVNLPLDALRAFVRLLARETAREILESGRRSRTPDGNHRAAGKARGQHLLVKGLHHGRKA